MPTALIHFGVVAESDTTSFLKPECAAKLTSPSAAVIEAARFRYLKTYINYIFQKYVIQFKIIALTHIRGLINQTDDISESASTTSGAHGFTDPSSKPHLVGGSFKQSSASAGPSGEKKLPKWFKPSGK